MNRVICGFAALFLTAGVLAVDDPIAARQDLMKDVREGAKQIGGMLKGDIAFDQQAAMEALGRMDHATDSFGDLFPEGSETGGDTEASPAIWTDRDGFNEKLASFAGDVDSAIAANPDSLDSFKPVAGKVMKNCKSCHTDFRVKKD